MICHTHGCVGHGHKEYIRTLACIVSALGTLQGDKLVLTLPSGMFNIDGSTT